VCEGVESVAKELKGLMGERRKRVRTYEVVEEEQ
jgi:hypothetical protein